MADETEAAVATLRERVFAYNRARAELAERMRTAEAVRDTLSARLAEREAAFQAREAEYLALAARFDRLRAMRSWAEIEIGGAVAEGDEVRYLLGTWRCVKAHVKSLLRVPTNGEYWAMAEDA